METFSLAGVQRLINGTGVYGEKRTSVVEYGASRRRQGAALVAKKSLQVLR